MSDQRFAQSLRITGALANIAQVCDFVVSQAERAGFDERGQYQCHLSVEEACTNVVEHGYQFQGDDKFIEVVCTAEGIWFTIVIIDEGPPYNPLMQPTPDPLTPLDEREGGGWGVAFIRKMMDQVDYAYKDAHNQLILSKKRA
jgi:anti-sigma regulatory factor (Ser/Thr protein kinase)